MDSFKEDRKKTWGEEIKSQFKRHFPSDFVRLDFSNMKNKSEQVHRIGIKRDSSPESFFEGHVLMRKGLEKILIPSFLTSFETVEDAVTHFELFFELCKCMKRKMSEEFNCTHLQIYLFTDSEEKKEILVTFIVNEKWKWRWKNVHFTVKSFNIDQIDRFTDEIKLELSGSRERTKFALPVRSSKEVEQYRRFLNI